MRYFPDDEAQLAALRFESDSHWNRASHALVAGALVEILISEGLLGPHTLEAGYEAQVGERLESVSEP